MVALSQITASNARIGTSLPSGMVAVFVGSTSGIGEFAMKAFAKYASCPRIYFVGRSQASADRILGELKAVNEKGDYSFIQADLSLIKNVEKVCEQIKSKEQSINLLFQSQGSLATDDTAEGIPASTALPYLSRLRFIISLLPLLQKATGLKRSVSVFAGTTEGNVMKENWYARKVRNPDKFRSHLASMITLAQGVLARQSPDVSFVHNFPGSVRTGFGREHKVAMSIFNAIWGLGVRFLSPDECGENHAFFATSAAYPPASDTGATGVPLADGLAVARGYDGKNASGNYTIDEKGVSASDKVEGLLAKMVSDGTQSELWEFTVAELERLSK